MRRTCVHNLNRTDIALLIAGCADSFFSQLRGFTFRRNIRPDEGLLLVQKHDNRIDSAIHMFFVFTDLAVVWINSDLEVVDTRLARAWRPAYVPKRACRYVLEMNPLRMGDFEIGDRVRFEDVMVD
jgi:uncharacterized membrane protein (UPF0127 family)